MSSSQIVRPDSPQAWLEAAGKFKGEEEAMREHIDEIYAERRRQREEVERELDMETPKIALQFVVCINNTEYPSSLERNKIYRTLPDEDAAADGDLRIIDESGEDYLYPANWFFPIALPQVLQQSVLFAA